MKISGFFLRYLLCLVLFNLAACSTMYPVSVENAMQQPQPSGVDYGSLVEVKTLDRKTAKFRVTEMTPEGLGGSMGFFRYEDMQSLKVENQSRQYRDSSETWAWVLGVLGVIGLIVLAANSDSVRVCSSSPCPTPTPTQ
ncbi:MAG TPA: hypothetical protein VFG52_10885 [Xanthomonadales bacterium]|nr:hypothetical protein [Xanthomonadales bacterium]